MLSFEPDGLSPARHDVFENSIVLVSAAQVVHHRVIPVHIMLRTRTR